MRILVIGLIVLGVAVSVSYAQSQNNTRPTIANEEDFHRAMKELSNWGRWGDDDELGAANLISPAKRKQALALAKEGVAISLAHDVAQEKAADAPFILERTPAGCPKGNINALKDGVVTRAILFDATLLAGKATPEGWLEPGTPVHREDLETLEKLEHVKVAPGDVILLYTGRWKRRAEKGPWGRDTGFAGYHADVAYFLKERGVSFIGCDGPNDVLPTGFPPTVTNPLHRLALVAMGVSIFDNLDFERAVEHARQLTRYEFLFSAAPLRIALGTGSPLNPLAIF